MSRAAKIIYYALVVLNLIELTCGIGQLALSRFPAAEISESQVTVAYFLIANSIIMLCGLVVIGRRAAPKETP
jgi:hypothetical protein